ncbi:TonB-dependent Receptor Plug Domain [Terriglobus roseus]|uniref:TonB-dependent Receptor Plug Domain n=2 Tax=Terriglobus roseus TaxID=392734 RepID=A0A1H4KJH0_9BACT|nr:TonB-dependent Receptor Plug Domain [Terriglobus roseus]
MLMNRKRRPSHPLAMPVARFSALSLVCVATSGAALAQGANASLSGIVQDATGAHVAHARVTVVEQGKNARRTAESNDAGLYVLPQLPAGQYVVSVDAPGFATAQRNLMLTVGEHADLDVRVQIQATADVTVETSETVVEREDPSLSTVTGERSIRQLPLNGRDVTQLALLSPGVVPMRRGNPDSQGLGRQISISGRRTNQVEFLLDGTDVNDAYNNTPGGASGVILGVDSIAQFRVLVNGYGAEFGRTGGGVIDQITRSGSNRLHGSAFEFVRNSAMDTKNYFDSATQPIPHFTRNQFGGALGGPVGHGKTFYFGNYEGIRQALGTTTSAIVPNAASRARGVAAVQPYLAIIPTANGVDYGDGTAAYVSTSNATLQEDFAIGRMDRTLSDRTSIFGRYQFDNANVYTPDNLQISRAHNRSRAQYVTAQMTHSFSPRLVNQTRVAYNRSYYTLQYDITKTIDPSLSFVPGRPFGSISITGGPMIGPMRFGPNVNALNLFEGNDDLTLTLGRHTLAFGVDEKQIIFPQESAQSQNGFYQFNSVALFLAGTASSVEIALPGSNPQRKWRQHMDSAYITDTWRATDALSITGGLRYERTSVPNEVNGLQANVRNVLTDTADTVGPMYTNPSNLNFAPRLGFAYSPRKASNTSVRGAFGVYFDPLWTDFYLNAGSRQPPFYTIGGVKTGTPITFPNTVITSSNFSLGRIDVVQYNPASPYVMQWNLSVQQQLAKGAVLTIAYDANRGVHDQRITDENQAIPQIVNGRKFFPTTSVVRNPNFTSIRYKKTDGLSSVNALQATLSWQFHDILQMRSTYIWQKSIDTSSLVSAQGSENDITQDPDSLRAEKGLSNYDLRNYSSNSITSNLPNLGGPGWLGKGWSLNGIALFSSGAPFSALISFDNARARIGTGPSQERPDLFPGRSSNPIKGGPVQYFDPTAFALPTPGFFGNLGRNTMIGPGLVSIDGALNKSFAFGERARLQLRGEVFNIPNRPNFGIPSQRNVFATGGARVGSAGVITSTLTSSRQIQLGARFEF